jgi:hypothetical protein
MKQLLIWIFERRLTLLLFPSKGPIMDIWKFRITGYEVGTGVNFQKMMGTRGIQIFEIVRTNGHICIYHLVWYPVNTSWIKQIPIPTLVVGTPGCQNMAPSTWGEILWAKESPRDPTQVGCGRRGCMWWNEVNYEFCNTCSNQKKTFTHLHFIWH